MLFRQQPTKIIDSITWKISRDINLSFYIISKLIHQRNKNELSWAKFCLMWLTFICISKLFQKLRIMHRESVILLDIAGGVLLIGDIYSPVVSISICWVEPPWYITRTRKTKSWGFLRRMNINLNYHSASCHFAL